MYRLPRNYDRRLPRVARHARRCLLAGWGLLALAALAMGQPPAYEPAIAGASDEARRAIAGFQPAAGLQVELFAAEPLLANPVAICLDEHGRLYVAETFRQERGVEDNRRHMAWLDDDIASRTVEDRLRMYQKHLGERIAEYTRHHDRVRLVEDRDGDGRADHSTVFADGFNDVLEGTGAGLIARDGNVWYTCIPKLWLLRDEDGDGRAEQRRALHHGYGVHVAFRGHDLHGLTWGPDGKLYFSIGDRGLHVETPEGTISVPHTGAVLRCQPDGSELELFCVGLRNPQELAFNELGDLFTGENNSDSGDRARFVHLVEGGDSGWLMSLQYFADRGPWNRERLWHPYHEGQAAWIVPPVANIADGPSGLAYYPGTGLDASYRGTFFLCDFRGNSVNSGVRTVRLRPKGAGYELAHEGQFIWRILATDVEFGPDSAVYVSDWVNGWTGEGRGRVYRIVDPLQRDAPQVREVRALLGGGLAQQPPARLAALLEHGDQRVRLEAQFRLAALGTPQHDLADEARAALRDAARAPGDTLRRLHAVWGLGQIARHADHRPEAVAPLLNLLADDHAEVRAQAAKVLGELRHTPARATLLRLLADPAPRVRFFAALSVGKLGPAAEALEPLLAMLRDNADADPLLRHAGVMGLYGAVRPETLLAAGHGAASAAVRRAVVVALRRHAWPGVARFLNDPDPSIVAEAARAIHDVPITEAFAELARLAEQPGLPEAALRRAVSAALHLGTAEHAQRVARLASAPAAAEAVRIEAMQALAQWDAPHPRDRVLGLWRPAQPRTAGHAQQAVSPVLGGLFVGSTKVREQAARLAATLQLGDAGPLLHALAVDRSADAAARVHALQALAALRAAELGDALRAALEDAEAEVRAAGLPILAQTAPDEALPRLRGAAQRGTLVERQAALAALGTIRVPEADALLADWLEQMLRGQVAAEVQLDLLTAAAQRKDPSVREKLAAYEAARPSDDPLAQFRETLYGGDARRGEDIFYNRVAVACRRCHAINGSGGNIGPELTRIGSQKTREYLLEALVAPDRTIAQGFESVVLTTVDGRIFVGILKGEDDRTLRLQTAEGNYLTIDKDQIDDRARGRSAMPDDLPQHLTKHELRDLVEFLSRLR